MRSAVKNTWKKVYQLVNCGILAKGHTILVVLRVLAVLICKTPERHNSVVKYCVDPLGKELKEETKKRLLEVFHDWLPALKEEFETDLGPV